MLQDTRTPLTRRERRRGGIEFWACMKALYIFLESVQLDWPLEQSAPTVFLLHTLHTTTLSTLLNVL
jgi:hypothetical protein